ncbi:MAG: semialdehyde dehydrogenase, partial [Solirubrobacterales bacterium]|nr:semialdehyde dehydrogenase [Solirubrobacterales bacterium]
EARLRDRGLTPTPLADAAREADAAIVAVPDELIARVAAEVMPLLEPGGMAVVLDAAAPFASPLAERDDVGLVVVHPCHPSVFTTQLTADGRRDYAGGVTGQDVVCCLARGTEEHYARGERLARDMFAPVDATHRITLDQFILLEPTMSETTTATLLTVIREAMDEAVRRGVPPAAARAFMYGHVGIELAIIFGELDAAFSASAYLAIEEGRERLLRPDWKDVFEPVNVRAVAEAIAVP